MMSCNKNKTTEYIFFNSSRDFNISKPDKIIYNRDVFKTLNDTIIEWTSFTDSICCFEYEERDTRKTFHKKENAYQTLLFSTKGNIPFNPYVDLPVLEEKTNPTAKHDKNNKLYLDVHYLIAKRVYVIDNKKYVVFVYKRYFKGYDGESWIYYNEKYGILAQCGYSWGIKIFKRTKIEVEKLLLDSILNDTTIYPMPTEIKIEIDPKSVINEILTQ